MKAILRLICQAAEKYEELISQKNKESYLLLKKLDFFKELIKKDESYGEPIRKNNLTKNRKLLNMFFQRYDYRELYNLDNCYCCDLTRTEWRMLYTLMKNKNENILYILCFMIIDHKTYEKYFT